MPETTTVGALREAARLIREYGFVQGRFKDPETGAICARGAVNLAVYGSVTGVPIYQGGARERTRALVNAVTKALSSLLPPAEAGCNQLVAWADAEGRTKEEVVAMLEAAADEEERRGEASGDPGGQGEDHHGGGD